MTGRRSGVAVGFPVQQRVLKMKPSTRILLLCVSVWTCPGALLAQEQQRFEPKHIAKIQAVRNVAVAPDGELLAYTVTVPRRPLSDDDGPAWSELYVVDREGNSRPFITGEVTIGAPQWSPDGDWLYYTAKRDGDSEASLYRIPIDGGESLRILTHPTGVGDFDLSPDGQQVAFLATEQLTDGLKELREKGFDQEIYEEDWKFTRVWVAALPQQRSAAAKDDEPKSRMLELNGSASEVQWSPSGRELLVTLATTPSVDDRYMGRRIHIVEAESGRTVREIGNEGKLGEIAWSPDGKRIAYVSGEDIYDPHEGRLMVTAVDGDGKATDLLPELEGHIASIAWADQSTLYWLAADGVSSRFGSVTLDGKREDLIEPGGTTVFSSFRRANDADTLAFLAENATHPTELFVTTDADEMPERVTHLNPWLEKMTFARQEVVQWKADDGLQLEGVLIYPLDYVEGRRYPTIMYVHGGPESREVNGWLTSYSRPGQVAAADGFAVFYPNYRGSIGRGVEFSKQGQADAAGKEFEDLIDGIDHLIETGITQPDAVGITGGSYGGFASAWGATYYSDRFAASVMFVGISDNVSKIGTTDIPEEMYLVHHRKRLWDDWEYFLKRSPIYYVERNQTPTLIMHGKEDPRVHPSQSLELFRHLKTLGQAPARLVLYEGEGHGNRKAAAQLDYNLRMLRWMRHYLQGEGGDPPPRELDYRELLDISEDE